MKHTLTALATLLAVTAGATMEPATPESQGVSSADIVRWLDAVDKMYDGGPNGAQHGFVIVRHGKVIAEGSWKPFDTLNETHMLYSHSKSFTSTAVGLLADDAKLDLDERVVDIFSNDVPKTVSKNLAALRVRDLLTMNAGKRDHRFHGGTDWVKSFLADEFIAEPGKRFRYDSDATYMLAAIVELRSGMKMMDFLKARLFDKIGITSAWTTYSPQGIPCGGWGMNITTRDLARFGQLYLDRGKWNGETVISSGWVQLATARQTWNGSNFVSIDVLGKGNDWMQGYGFQFWRCRHDAFRADGAYGQYTIVMPEQDAVVSISAGLNDMQAELNLVWDYLLPAMKCAPLAENTAAQDALKRRIAALAIAAPKMELAKPAYALEGKTFTIKDNVRKFKSVRFENVAAGKNAICVLVTPAGEQRFTVGAGEWVRGGKIRIDTEDYENLGTYCGEHPTSSAWGVDREGTFRMKTYLIADTGFIEFKVDKTGKLTGEFYAMRGCKFEGAAE